MLRFVILMEIVWILQILKDQRDLINLECGKQHNFYMYANNERVIRWCVECMLKREYDFFDPIPGVKFRKIVLRWEFQR